MPQPPQVVHVHLGPRSYEIQIGTGNLTNFGQALPAVRDASHVVVIADENIVATHAAAVAESLRSAGLRCDVLSIPPGETSKSVAMADRLWQQLLDRGADRRSVVVAVGGGVTGDLAGFVAATFARGLAFVQVPTTLLAQVDSSVGGKVGVNLPGAKNMVGAFWQPAGVLIDTQTLATLPDREYRAGLAEVVKYGVILDAGFFAYLEGNAQRLLGREADVLEKVISRSCRLKADVVEQDEREESGVRAALNYGHTFAHALEAVCGYGRLLHGEAVAIGMVCASRLAHGLGRVDAELTHRQQRLISQLGLPVQVPDVSHEALLSAMSHDKKVAHGRLRFVLPRRLGEVELVGDVPVDAVRAALTEQS